MCDERPVRAEVLGQRAVAANDRQVQAQLARDANRHVDAAPGHEDHPDPALERAPDRVAVSVGDLLVGVEERAVEVEGDEVDAHGPARGSGIVDRCPRDWGETFA